MYCYIDRLGHYAIELLNVMCGFLENNIRYSDRLNSIYCKSCQIRENMSTGCQQTLFVPENTFLTRILHTVSRSSAEKSTAL